MRFTQTCRITGQRNYAYMYCVYIYIYKCVCVRVPCIKGICNLGSIAKRLDVQFGRVNSAVT